MAQDSFLGAFQGLPWPLAHAAAAGTPFDALRVQMPLMGGGTGAVWDHDVGMSSLVSPSSLAAATTVGGAHEAVLMEQLANSLVTSVPSPPSPRYALCYSSRSLVSPSSLAAATTVGGAHEAVLMEQLANSLVTSVPSPPSPRYALCYRTPVGSPSKPVAPGNAADAAFAERAARPSRFAVSDGKLSRAASTQSLLAEPAQSPGGVALHTGDDCCSDGPSRKRKVPAGGKPKAKEAMTTATAKSLEAKRVGKKSKLSAEVDEDDEPKPAAGDAERRNGKGKEVIVAEPPKEYIHVRARRGQATDSHSLAERVRREKISERMKLLQDIVPGCSKVTGKAVMLDEIINYVQSLQRQVEFLSMKLSTVDPCLEVDVNSSIQKDANQSCVVAPTSLPPAPQPVYSMEGSNSAFCYASPPAPAAQSAVTNAKSFETPSSFVNHSIQNHSLEGRQNANSQIGSPWEDDLQSLVQMGFQSNT